MCNGFCVCCFSVSLLKQTVNWVCHYTSLPVFAFVSVEIPTWGISVGNCVSRWLARELPRKNWMIWRNVPSVLRCSPTLEFCRVSTRFVSSVCWTTARTDHLETTCLVRCAGKSSLFRTTGYRGCRRTSSWRNCFMQESFQLDMKRIIFRAMYAAVREVINLVTW